MTIWPSIKIQSLKRQLSTVPVQDMVDHRRLSLYLYGFTSFWFFNLIHKIPKNRSPNVFKWYFFGMQLSLFTFYAPKVAYVSQKSYTIEREDNTTMSYLLMSVMLQNASCFHCTNMILPSNRRSTSKAYCLR